LLRGIFETRRDSSFGKKPENRLTLSAELRRLQRQSSSAFQRRQSRL